MDWLRAWLSARARPRPAAGTRGRSLPFMATAQVAAPPPTAAGAFNEPAPPLSHSPGAIPSFDDLVSRGHLAKAVGNYTEALEALAKASRLKTSATLFEDIVQLNAQIGRLKPQNTSKRLLFSVDDILSYMSAHDQLSGIQRLITELAANLIDIFGEDVGFYFTYKTPMYAAGTLGLLRHEDARDIFLILKQGVHSRAELNRAVTDCYLHAAPVTASAGNTLLLPGSFWGLTHPAHHYVNAKRNGARLCVVICDLIPITHPAYCNEDAATDFTAALAIFSKISDLIICISRFTQSQLLAYVPELASEPHRTVAIPLATASLLHAAATPASAARDAARRQGRFALYVATLEARKNHALLAHCWKALADSGLHMPTLVFVGRPGWKTEELQTLLAKTDNIDGKVEVLSDVSDADLRQLYQDALFTVYPSLVEGWGLPVGESLALGTVCAASHTSSIPEVGGDLVDYFDPADAASVSDVLKRLVTDGAYLKARREQIRTSFAPRTWPQYATEVVAAITAMQDRPSRPAPPGEIAAGVPLRPADFFSRKVKADLVRAHTGFAFSLVGFDHVDEEGAWLMSGAGRIEFRPAPELGARVAVSLVIRARRCIASLVVDTSPGVRFEVELPRIEHDDLARPYRLTAHLDVDADGWCRFTLGSRRWPDSAVRARPPGGLCLVEVVVSGPDTGQAAPKTP